MVWLIMLYQLFSVFWYDQARCNMLTMKTIITTAK